MSAPPIAGETTSHYLKGRSEDPSVVYTTQQTRTYPCKNCGADLFFDPSTQQLGCKSCGSSIAFASEPPRPLVKHDIEPALAALHHQQRQQDDAPSFDKEIVCQSCGGHTIFSGTLTATRCPYCNVAIQREDIGSAPTRLAIDGIIPLQVDEKQSLILIEKWINSRLFAPNAFKKHRQLGSFTSIYLPYYSYDSATTTHYSGMRGIHRTEYYQVDGKTQSRIVTDWYPASGVVRNEFTNVTSHASSGLDDDKLTELEPWPLENIHPYSAHFTAGHLSRTYDHEPDVVFEQLTRPRLESVIEDTIRDDIGGDCQQIDSQSTTWHFLTFAHLLLPVWMLTVTFAGKPYNVLINGVTGEVQGQRPWSWIKITAAVIAVCIAIALIYFFISHE